jgi:hypothetical protein
LARTSATTRASARRYRSRRGMYTGRSAVIISS